MPRPNTTARKRAKPLLIAAFAVVAAAALLLPNMLKVRENAQRVNDLANLNGLYKAIASWGLRPEAALGKAPIELPLKGLRFTSYTGQPIEYYEGVDNVMLVSRVRGGCNIIRASGSGMWIDDGSPQAEELARNLAGRAKQPVENLFKRLKNR